MTEFRHTLREMLESAIADMEELSAERQRRRGVLKGKVLRGSVLSKAGPGGTGTSEQGELDGTPRPLQEDE